MKYRSFLFLLFTIAWSSIGSAQVFDPVDWSFSSESTGGDEYILRFNAKIDKGWYVYAQDIPDNGPIPTNFTIEEMNGLELLGATEETGLRIEKGFDKVFEMNIKKFAGSASFSQRVRYTGSDPVRGYLEYMTCNDERCLPPEMLDFAFDLGKPEAPQGEGSLPPSDADTETGVTEAPVPPVEGKPDMEASRTTDLVTEATSNENPFGNSKGFGITIEGDETDEAADGGILQPVTWQLTTEKSGGSLTLIFRAAIDKGWYIYSQRVPPDGPESTTINFIDSTALTLSGPAAESGTKVMDGWDQVFRMRVKKFAESAEFRQTLALDETAEQPVQGFIVFMTCDDRRCLPPEMLDFTVDLKSGTAAFDELGDIQETGSSRFKPVGDPVREDCAEARQFSSWWIAFLLGLGGGLLALLTPCVFPMIPLTVSFFTKKQGQSRSKGLFDASFYGFSIFLIYFLLSLPFLIFQIPPDTLNEIATSVPLNLIFFTVFIVFAISFFGFFELTLPSGFATKVDKATGIGGIMGIFFMALTLAIVSFSCTGPILGSLLGSMLTAEGGQYNLVAGMSGFGIALGLPFALFAAFPKMLEKLPRSGDWMDRFKKALGFLELGLALKFLSNADLVAQWGFLKREIFLGIWILIGLAWILHTAGLLRLPHDGPQRRISAMGWAMITVISGFSLYLFSGLFGNNLQLLSGFPPPMHYSILHHEESRLAKLTVFRSLDEGVTYAKENNRPLMLDFTGWACVNCRKMEENVWVQDPIYQTLSEEYVIVSLYVDEKIELAEEDQYVSERTGKKVRTVGNYWTDYEISVFNNNSQPLYALMTPDLELLSHPVGYMPDQEQYHAFLTCGLQAFREVNGLAQAD